MSLSAALAILVTSFLVGLSGAVSPGPLLAYNIRQTVRIGFWAGPFVSLGHSLLELAVVVALALGIARALEVRLVSTVIALAGGVFLLWMGLGMVRKPGTLPQSMSSSSLHTKTKANPDVASGLAPMAGGVFVSLSNPFWALWWLTVGSGFLAQALDQGLGVLGVAAFYVGHILSDFGWYSLVSAAIASGRRLMTDRLYKGIVIACGLFLWAMAGLFLVRGIREVV